MPQMRCEWLPFQCCRRQQWVVGLVRALTPLTGTEASGHRARIPIHKDHLQLMRCVFCPAEEQRELEAWTLDPD